MVKGSKKSKILKSLLSFSKKVKNDKLEPKKAESEVEKLSREFHNFLAEDKELESFLRVPEHKEGGKVVYGGREPTDKEILKILSKK